MILKTKKKIILNSPNYKNNHPVRVTQKKKDKDQERKKMQKFSINLLLKLVNQR
jgi:hypothetical protein